MSSEINSDTYPNLINDNFIETIKKHQSNLPNGHTNHPSSLSTFYSNFIRPNLFPLIVITLLVIYLLINYFIKNDVKHKKNEKYRRK